MASVYCTDHCSYLDRGYLCGAENRSQRFFYGNYTVRYPKRYDIVVFPYQYQDNTYYIKRIIGLPGETVQILSGMVYIDGMRLDEHYGNEIMENPGIAEEPLTLGEDEYFVLGDNRNNSSDSRASDVGLIHRKDLIGRAWIRVWPLSQIGVIHHE